MTTPDFEQLEALLREMGATDAELATAREEHTHGALALELALRDGRPPVGLDEAATRICADPSEVARFWQALGFSNQPGQRVPAAVVDAQALTSAIGMSWLSDDASLAIARVVGSATARLAEAVVDAFRMGFEVPSLSAGTAYSDIVRGYVAVTREVLPAFEEYVGAVFKAHLVRVAAGAWAPGEDAEAGTRRDLAIAFADLVGYTALSRTIGARELARLLAAFEDGVAETLATHGGRLVKAIGDGVMLAMDSPEIGCAVACDLAARFGASDVVPPVRVGLTFGPVLSRYGDYYGDVVNLAARLVALARPGTVTVSDRIAGTDGWAFEQLPAQALKGFGTPPAVFRLVGPA